MDTFAFKETTFKETTFKALTYSEINEITEDKFFEQCLAYNLSDVALGYRINSRFWVGKQLINNAVVDINQFVTSDYFIGAKYHTGGFCTVGLFDDNLLILADKLATIYHNTRLTNVLTVCIHDVGDAMKKIPVTATSAPAVTQILDLLDIAKIQFKHITVKNQSIDWRQICAAWTIHAGNVPDFIFTDGVRLRQIVNAIYKATYKPDTYKPDTHKLDTYKPDTYKPLTSQPALSVSCEMVDLMHENRRRALSIAEDRFGHYSRSHQLNYTFIFHGEPVAVPSVINLIVHELSGHLTMTPKAYILSIIAPAISDTIISPRARVTCLKHQEKKQHIALIIEDEILKSAAFKLMAHLGYCNITFHIMPFTQYVITDYHSPNYNLPTLVFSNIDKLEECLSDWLPTHTQN
jgi:hypothetical protein